MLKNYEEKLKNSLKSLFENDFYLIEKNLNEISISHKLACYLQKQFDELSVDCEYNGNANNPDDIKLICIIEKKGKVRFDGKEHLVYPDIIVHKRGSNDYNELIIEIKKSTNNKRNKRCFDHAKLEFYTNESKNSFYPYKLGCFMIINTGQKEIKKCCLTWYQNGKVIKEENINLDPESSDNSLCPPVCQSASGSECL